MKTISLDIQHDFLDTLDISGFFAISEVHAINNGAIKPILDEILGELPLISLAKHQEVEVEDFVTFPTLDIVHEDLLASTYWQKRYPEIIARKKRISLIDPLDVPFDALDIRTLSPIASEKKYSDLYKRKLSSSLYVRRFSKASRKFYQKNQKRILYSFATLFLVSIPLLLAIKFSVESGYNKLLSLREAHNIGDIQSKIQSAKSDFERADFLFLPFSWLPGNTIDLVNRATSGGKSLTTALSDIVSTLPSSGTGSGLKIVENGENSAFRGHSKDIFPLENMGVPLPTNWIAENQTKMNSALSELENAGSIFAGVHGNSSYAHKMRQVGAILEAMSPAFEQYKNHNSEIMTMLGHRDPQRYIIFNQNRDEVRANGWFPGSIISFTLYKGNILDYRTDDVYYYDWNLYPHTETPPPGIALLTNNYGLRDVNYYPDFRETLDKANSFIEKSGDSTITTGIAIHQGMIEEILGVIGPVKLDGVDIAFDKDNFSLLMSLLVENKFAKEKTPKDILFTFISKFGEQTLKSGKIEEVIKVIENNWNRGEIVIASRNDDIHNYLKTLQKSLPWESGDRNWIYPVFTSVSGNKSDRYIDRSLEVKTKLVGRCEYETTAHLTHHHTYSRDDELLLEKYMATFGLTDAQEQHKMRFIQGKWENQSFVRMYVPKWAVLSGSGADVSEEENATVFSFTLKTPIGETAEKTLTYKQNIANCTDYDEKITVYRQPGLHNLLLP